MAYALAQHLVKVVLTKSPLGSGEASIGKLPCLFERGYVGFGAFKGWKVKASTLTTCTREARRGKSLGFD